MPISPRHAIAAGIFSCALMGWLGDCELCGQEPEAPAAASPAQTIPWPPDAESPQSLADRLQALEEVNRQLADQLDQMGREQAAEMRGLWERLGLPAEGGEDGLGTGVEASDGDGYYRGPGEPARAGSSPVPDYTEGHFAPKEIPSGFVDPAILSPSRFPLRATFGPGFTLQTLDGKHSLQIRYESQIEGRVWGESDQIPANSGFFLPRQRFFFDGNITESIEYELAINRGVNNINLLNAYLNFHFDDRLQVRLGRFFTPFTYDQYGVSNYWLLTPERSLFVTNLSPNRQIGLMAWGYLLDKRLDYAVGTFNGSRNSFESLNNSLDLVSYINARPFQQAESWPLLRFLNVGSSIAFGRQDQSPVPATFRVGAGSPDANIPSIATVPFLIFSPGVVERGDRLLGSVHAAYFYHSLSVIGEWQYGYGDYARVGNVPSAKVPFSGFYVASGYFLTGEHVERRTRLKPLRSLLPVSDEDERGIGAWEVTARVSQLRAGEEVFDEGFADPQLWSDSATVTEMGTNWYWNEYIKWYTFWLHADFGSPVQYRPGQRQESADMFWIRCQLYF